MVWNILKAYIVSEMLYWNSNTTEIVIICKQDYDCTVIARWTDWWSDKLIPV